jgi:hypothetical protein
MSKALPLSGGSLDTVAPGTSWLLAMVLVTK